MAKQEIEFVDVIADDDFSAPGGMVRKGETFRCTRSKAKELVGTGQAHYPTDEDREALAGDQDDGEPEKPADDGKADDGKKAPASNAKKSEPAKS